MNTVNLVFQHAVYNFFISMHTPLCYIYDVGKKVFKISIDYIEIYQGEQLVPNDETLASSYFSSFPITLNVIDTSKKKSVTFGGSKEKIAQKQKKKNYLKCQICRKKNSILYCRKCNMFICFECNIRYPEHFDHEKINLESGDLLMSFEEYRKKIISQLNELNEAFRYSGENIISDNIRGDKFDSIMSTIQDLDKKTESLTVMGTAYICNTEILKNFKKELREIEGPKYKEETMDCFSEVNEKEQEMKNYVPFVNLQIIKSKFTIKLQQFFKDIHKLLIDMINDVDDKLNDTSQLREMGFKELIKYNEMKREESEYSSSSETINSKSNSRSSKSEDKDKDKDKEKTNNKEKESDNRKDNNDNNKGKETKKVSTIPNVHLVPNPSYQNNSFNMPSFLPPINMGNNIRLSTLNNMSNPNINNMINHPNFNTNMNINNMKLMQSQQYPQYYMSNIQMYNQQNQLMRNSRKRTSTSSNRSPVKGAMNLSSRKSNANFFNNNNLMSFNMVGGDYNNISKSMQNMITNPYLYGNQTINQMHMNTTSKTEHQKEEIEELKSALPTEPSLVANNKTIDLIQNAMKKKKIKKDFNIKVSKKLKDNDNGQIDDNKDDIQNELEKDEKILAGFGLSPRKKDTNPIIEEIKKSNVKISNITNNNVNNSTNIDTNINTNINTNISKSSSSNVTNNPRKTVDVNSSKLIFPIGIQGTNIIPQAVNSPKKERISSPKKTDKSSSQNPQTSPERGIRSNEEKGDQRKNTLYDLMQNQKQKEDENTQEEYRNYMKLIGQPLPENAAENTSTINNENKDKKQKKKKKKKKKKDEEDDIDDFQTGTAFRAKNEIIDLSKIYTRILSTKKVNKKKK